MNNNELEITSLERKLEESFASEKRGMTVSQLEFELLQLSKHKEDIVTSRNEDDELQRIKELVKELAAPYRESLKANTLKSRFIALLLKEKKE